MSFLDKFKNTAAAASQAATAVAGKAGSNAKNAAAIARLKVNIAAEEDKLKKAYAELGRLFLRDLDAQAEADMVEYNPWCEKAHDARDAINRMMAEVDELKAQLRTPAGANAAENANAEPAAVAADETEVTDPETTAPEAVQEPATEAAVEATQEETETAESEDTSIFAD